MATDTTAIAGDLQTYFAKKLLKQANYKTVLDQFGHKENIPSSSSKTIQFVQYADLAIVTTPLSEGVAPAGSSLSNTPITATIDQLGDYTVLTDLAKLTPKHSSVQKALELLGTQAARSYDRAINNVVVAGTAVRYAKGAADRAALAAASATDAQITWNDVRTEVTRLRKSGAEEFEDGNFVLVVRPEVEQDLMDDADFKAAVQHYAAKAGRDSELFKGTIVVFAGVRVVRSNNLVTATQSGKTIQLNLIFGTDGYGVTDLQSLETYKEGPGGVTDPLRQKMTLGWKVGTKTVILNNNFMGRIESISKY